LANAAAFTTRPRQSPGDRRRGSRASLTVTMLTSPDTHRPSTRHPSPARRSKPRAPRVWVCVPSMRSDGGSYRMRRHRARPATRAGVTKLGHPAIVDSIAVGG
jgi:hypothetical protein